MNEKEKTRVSRFLSLVLRHKPEEAGITLDNEGYVQTANLLIALKKKGYAITFEQLNEIVETNEKKRFAFSSDHKKIRASQGHSVSDVDLKFEAKLPPHKLYHGTVHKFLNDIKKSGLQKMSRQYLHLSKDTETAVNVGSRRGDAIILEIDAFKMSVDGFTFYESANGVWLTEQVPYKYITIT